VGCTPPATVADFKAQFPAGRGWPYGTGSDTVTDADITAGIAMALTVWNPSLFSTLEAKPVFLLAAAHFVVTAVQAGGGLRARAEGTPGAGLGGKATENTGSGIIASKTVDKVSVAYAGFETLVTRFPTLAAMRTTDFGQQYALIVAPRLCGRVGIASNEGAPDAVIPAVPFLA
jgi:hypothetical protein